MKISYCITTHNEDKRYIKTLLDKILSVKDNEDEIIILDDYSDNEDTKNALAEYQDKVNILYVKFLGDFAQHKNELSKIATGDYIFQIDADELPNDPLLKILKEALIVNPDIDLFFLPRINLVEGLTPDDIRNWGWHVNDKYFINFPDFQGRIYKNKPEIKWEGKVHERITGANQFTQFTPFNESGEIVDDYCLLHYKTRDRQFSQNELYSKLQNK